MGEATHSNLYVRNLTAEVDEGLLQRFFSPFGQIESCRIVKNARTQASKGYGFVKFGSVESAQDAIAQLNGTACAGSLLEVKFADADAGRQGSGQVPGDNLYVRNVPANWSDQDLIQLFSPFGTVSDCRLLHSGDASRGVGALVRMGSIEEATRAIEALNNRVPSGGATLQLLVRYADTLEEKRAKRATSAVAGGYGARTDAVGGRADPPLPAGFTAFNSPADASAAMHNNLIGGALGGPSAHLGDAGHGNIIGYDNLGAGMAPGYSNANHHHHHHQGIMGPMAGTGPSSIYVKNLPPEADKLFLYERFAPHGAILSVKVLVDEQSGQCKGVGFVNYAIPPAALLAVQSLHGVRVGEKLLHVSLQTHTRLRNVPPHH